PLGLVAELEHGRRQQEDAVLRDAGRGAGPVVLLLEDQPLPQGGVAAAVGGGPRHRGPAALVEPALPGEVLGEALPGVAGADVFGAAVLVVPGGEVLLEPRPGLGPEGLLLVGPGQVHVGSRSSRGRVTPRPPVRRRAARRPGGRGWPSPRR